MPDGRDLTPAASTLGLPWQPSFHVFFFHECELCSLTQSRHSSDM